MLEEAVILPLKNMPLSSDRLELSGITSDDADHIVQWRSDPKLIRYFRNPTSLTMDTHRRWFPNYLTDPTRLDFIVTEKITGSPVGYAGFQDISFKESSTFVAYLIANQGFGYGREVVRTLCAYGLI